MPGPRRRRHASAVVGAAFALVLALGPVTLGGARTDHQTQVPVVQDRGTHRVPERGLIQRTVAAADHLVPSAATVPAALSLALALVVLLPVSPVEPGAQASRLVPVAVVFTLVGFIGTAVVARFIEGQGG